jgi:hypothetical protein
MYCVIKWVKNKRVLKGNFASSVFNIYDAKTQMTQICVTGPQCVKQVLLYIYNQSKSGSWHFTPGRVWLIRTRAQPESLGQRQSNPELKRRLRHFTDQFNTHVPPTRSDLPAGREARFARSADFLLASLTVDHSKKFVPPDGSAVTC